MSFIQILDAEIAALERELEAQPAYIKLKALRAARAAYSGGAVSPTPPDVQRSADVETTGRRRRQPAASGKSLDAVNAVIEILRTSGQPMRTVELLAKIEQRGITFEGSSPQNILSSLLSRSDDVVSKGGHIGWALTEWDSAGSGSAASVSPPADAQPQSAPVEPGEEVAHDIMS